MSLAKHHLEHPRVTAIVLAAGQSTRMGVPKLLLPWGETTLLGQTLQHVRQSCLAGAWVVTGAYATETAAIAHQQQLPPVHNAAWEAEEMLSSLQVGVRHLPAGVDGFAVVLGDMPFIEPHTIDLLVGSLQNHDEIIVPVYAGRRGHPVIFGRNHTTPLLNLPPHTSPRALLHATPHAVRHVPVSTMSVCLDLDTPALYEHWRPKA